MTRPEHETHAVADLACAQYCFEQARKARSGAELETWTRAAESWVGRAARRFPIVDTEPFVQF